MATQRTISIGVDWLAAVRAAASDADAMEVLRDLADKCLKVNHAHVCEAAAAETIRRMQERLNQVLPAFVDAEVERRVRAAAPTPTAPAELVPSQAFMNLVERICSRSILAEEIGNGRVLMTPVENTPP